MSIAALNWAWDQTELSSSAKLVLVALADRADDDGKCWPGMGTVATRACMSPRQVSRHLTALEDMGLISRRRMRRDDGTLGRYVYRLHIAQPTLTEAPADPDDPPDTDVQWTDPTSSHAGSSPPDTEGHHHRTPMSGQEATTSEPTEEPTLAPSAPERTSQVVDNLAASVVAACRMDPPAPRTRPATQLHAACRDLVRQGATPPSVAGRAAEFRRRWPDATLTPMALAKHWPQLVAPPPDAASSGRGNGVDVAAGLRAAGLEVPA